MKPFHNVHNIFYTPSLAQYNPLPLKLNILQNGLGVSKVVNIIINTVYK